MSFHDFIEKFNCSVAIAKKIKNRGPTSILLGDFPVYDINNRNCPHAKALEKCLQENPGSYKTSYTDPGPCSNWGYRVWIQETNKQFEDRIKEEIKKWEYLEK